MQPLPAGAVSAADWVRVRREFPGATLFSNVQYSFSVDATNMVETLVLRVRDPKDLMQVSIEDSASSVASAAAMLSASTPVSRVRLERFGKPSVALARCSGAEGNPATDQSAYEPIFRAASSIMERYRDALGARKMVPQELAHLRAGSSTKASWRQQEERRVGLARWAVRFETKSVFQNLSTSTVSKPLSNYYGHTQCCHHRLWMRRSHRRPLQRPRQPQAARHRRP